MKKNYGFFVRFHNIWLSLQKIGGASGYEHAHAARLAQSLQKIGDASGMRLAPCRWKAAIYTS